MESVDLKGKVAVVFGVANQRSIAWYIAAALSRAGATIAIGYQNERLGEGVIKLAATLPNATTFQCDVLQEEQVVAAFKQIEAAHGRVDTLVHSVAYALRDELGGEFAATSQEGFRIALAVSAYSLIPMTRYATPLMKDGGSVLTMTFQASQRAFPGYNVMGTAKAALEHEVRQLAYELGPKNIRVNAISAGPLDTLAARGIHGFIDMKRVHAERAPMRRNITHEEVAKAALFLCSDLASGVTGVILPVDTGYHIVGM